MVRRLPDTVEPCYAPRHRHRPGRYAGAVQARYLGRFRPQFAHAYVATQATIQGPCAWRIRSRFRRGRSSSQICTARSTASFRGMPDTISASTDTPATSAEVHVESITTAPCTGAARQRLPDCNNPFCTRDSPPSSMAIPWRVTSQPKGLTAPFTAHSEVVPGDSVHDTHPSPGDGISTRSQQHVSKAARKAAHRRPNCAIAVSAASSDGGCGSAGDSGIQPGASSSTTHVDDFEDCRNTACSRYPARYRLYSTSIPTRHDRRRRRRLGLQTVGHRPRSSVSTGAVTS